ncbi:hypothetical protein [Winslowiella arboricola]|uniref:hypothetical protein n=1 Tax=Winslowiella arboricola TaxID=2978220 RepID=UPI00225E22CC|nr:hypothetical protein [Winslowiella arboricola]MCU5775194.1 hypothetical protein [Winslowiella arboricola]
MNIEQSNKEVVQSAFTFAKALDSNTPLIDMAKVIADLATRLDVATVISDTRSSELTAAHLTINNLRELLNCAEGEDLADKVCELKMAATNAWLNDVRKGAISEALNSVDGMDADCVQDATGRDRDYCEAFVDGMLSVHGQISQFAAQLRAGNGGEHV